MTIVHEVCPDCGAKNGEGWVHAAQFCISCMRPADTKPDVTLVYYRDGGQCIERVTVVSGVCHVHVMKLGEALNTVAELSALTARLTQRMTADA